MHRSTRPVDLMALHQIQTGAAEAPGGRLLVECREENRRSTQRFEFNALGMLRLSLEGDDRLGLVLRDGREYFFGSLAGQPVTVDLQAATQRVRPQNATPTARGEVRETLIALEASGREQTVAGLAGETFGSQWQDADGNHRSEMLALTRDPRLAPLIATLAAFGPLTASGIRAPLLQGVAAQGWFVLRADGYRVVSARFESMPDKRFELCAPPSDDLRVMFRVALAAATGESPCLPAASHTNSSGSPQ